MSGFRNKPPHLFMTGYGMMLTPLRRRGTGDTINVTHGPHPSWAIPPVRVEVLSHVWTCIPVIRNSFRSAHIRCRMTASLRASVTVAIRRHSNTVRPHSSLGYRLPAPETRSPIQIKLGNATQKLAAQKEMGHLHRPRNSSYQFGVRFICRFYGSSGSTASRWSDVTDNRTAISFGDKRSINSCG